MLHLLGSKVPLSHCACGNARELARTQYHGSQAQKNRRPRLITLRGILFVHVVIYIGAILYTWWSFVDLIYAYRLHLFNQADVPLPLFHATLDGCSGRSLSR